MNVKKVLVGLVGTVAVLSLSASLALAGEIDVLLEKLVDKGYLTSVEATIIKDETRQQVSAEVAQGKSYASPSWTQKIKMKGDLRLRYQTEKKESTDHVRNRGRVRYRLGLLADVTKNVIVGAGLASGSSDPRSTNQTFEDSFETPDIRLDYAYGEWQPLSEVKIIAGKFKTGDYLWTPSDLLWDGDINPEGFSIGLNKSLSDNVDGFFNSGLWVLNENGTSRNTDPFMHYFQGGAKISSDMPYAKAAITYYGFNGVKGTCLDYSGGTNTGVGTASDSCTGSLMYDYDSLAGSLELGLTEPMGEGGLIEKAALIGDYVQNISDGVSKDTGWAVGAKVGSKKVGKPKTWQLKYLYAQLEADAFPDAFPDSDRFGGKTDIKGHEVAVEYALLNNVILGLDYYRTKRLDNSTDVEDLVQADVLFKF